MLYEGRKEGKKKGRGLAEGEISLAPVQGCCTGAHRTYCYTTVPLFISSKTSVLLPMQERRVIVVDAFSSVGERFSTSACALHRRALHDSFVRTLSRARQVDTKRRLTLD